MTVLHYHAQRHIHVTIPTGRNWIYTLHYNKAVRHGWKPKTSRRYPTLNSPTTIWHKVPHLLEKYRFFRFIFKLPFASLRIKLSRLTWAKVQLDKITQTRLRQGSRIGSLFRRCQLLCSAGRPLHLFQLHIGKHLYIMPSHELAYSTERAFERVQYSRTDTSSNIF